MLGLKKVIMTKLSLIIIRPFKRNPNLPGAYYNRAGAWAFKGNFDKALADYNKAIELNPNYADAYCNRGNAWFAKGDHDKAFADYDKAVRLNPNLALATTTGLELGLLKVILTKPSLITTSAI